MSQRSIRLDKGSITVRLRGAIGRILSLGGKNDPPPNPPLAKGRESQPVQRFHETPTRLVSKGGGGIILPPKKLKIHPDLGIVAHGLVIKFPFLTPRSPIDSD